MEMIKILNLLKEIKNNLEINNENKTVKIFREFLEEQKQKFKTKKLSDLTNKELLEDLAYYTNMAQIQSPSFTDNSYYAIWEDIKELFNRLKISEKRPKFNCSQCNLYGECDHQGAYIKDGKWCYE